MKNMRKSHRYVALIITLPLIITAFTGVILQLRDQFEFIQPAPVKIEMLKNKKFVSIEEIKARYPDFDQLIYRPQKGSLVVAYKDGTTIQIHPETGDTVKKAVRRTNFLIELHQGSWMGKFGQYVIHFTTGLGLCFLIISGLLIVLPRKRKKI